MKTFLLLIVGILMFPAVLGEIVIETTYADAFLGERLPLKVVLTPELDVEGVFSASLSCSSNSLQYFSKPVSLKAGRSLTIRVPALQAYLTGECGMVAQLSRLTGEVIEVEESDSFRIESVLDLDVTLDAEIVTPGDAVTLLGRVSRGGKAVTDAILTIGFQGTEQELPLSSGTIREKITLSDTAQSGKHAVLVQVEDSFGNVQEKRLELIVPAQPSELRHSVTTLSAGPGDTLGIVVLLLDQAGIILKEDVSIKLYKGRALRDDLILFSKVIPADSTFDFVIDNSMEPGTYVLESSHEGLRHVDSFVIEEVVSLDSTFEGNTLRVVNTGNVPYSNDAAISLVSDERVFVLKEKLRLDVNEGRLIDLSDGVPSGSYEAIVTEEPLTEDQEQELLVRKQSGNSITGMVVGQERIVGGAVEVDYGKRNALRRIGDATSSVLAPGGFSITPYLYLLLGLVIVYVLNRFWKKKGGSGGGEISPAQIKKQLHEHGVVEQK